MNELNIRLLNDFIKHRVDFKTIKDFLPQEDWLRGDGGGISRHGSLVKLQGIVRGHPTLARLDLGDGSLRQVDITHSVPHGSTEANYRTARLDIEDAVIEAFGTFPARSIRREGYRSRYDATWKMSTTTAALAGIWPAQGDQVHLMIAAELKAKSDSVPSIEDLFVYG